MADKLFSKPVRRLLVLALTVPCLLSLLPAIIAYRAQQELGNSSYWVSHTLEVQHELQHLLALLVNAETSQRGFLLIQRDYYLAPYNAAVTQIPEQTKQLRYLTADNPVQQSNLHQLAPLIATKLDFMAQTIALQKNGEHQDALELIGTDRGNQAMEAIRSQIVLMEQEESRLLKIRQATQAKHAWLATAGLISLAVLNLAFLVVVLLLFRRLARLQGLVTICAWSRTVEYQGEWLSFEEYLRKRFQLTTSHGISPTEIEKVFGAAQKDPQRV